MAKYTLLELVQTILRSIKGESVTNYNDTEESLMVADIIKECYFDLISTTDLDENKGLFELTETSALTPTVMTLPTNVSGLEWIKYNKNDEFFGAGFSSGFDTADFDALTTNISFQNVSYLPFKDFIDMTHQFNIQDSLVGEISLASLSADNTAIYFRQDKHPDFFTSYNDNTILFDSYLQTIETYLHSNRTMAYGFTEPTWTASNSFTPNLDAQQVNILLKEAKAMAWQELKSIENAKAEASARRTRMFAERKKNKINYDRIGTYYSNFPDYGRKR